MGKDDEIAQKILARARAKAEPRVVEVLGSSDGEVVVGRAEAPAGAHDVRPGSVVVWRHPALGVRLPAIVVATVESLSGVNLEELAEQNWPAIELGDGVVHLVVFTAANRDPVRGSLLAAPMVGFQAVEVPCFVAASVAFGDGPGEWSWPL